VTVSDRDQFLESMGRELAGWNDPTRRLREVLDRNELVLYCQPVAALAGETKTEPDKSTGQKADESTEKKADEA